MAEDFETMDVQADQEVDINNPADINYWTGLWEVSEGELRMAVANVGTEVSELRIALGR
jgi:hypothetical protein